MKLAKGGEEQGGWAALLFPNQAMPWYRAGFGPRVRLLGTRSPASELFFQSPGAKF